MFLNIFTKVKQFSGILLFCTLTGCASQIMGDFVGKPISLVVGQYGFPVGSYDIDKDTRAFVWQMNQTVVVPGTSYTRGSVIGNQIFASTYSSPTYSGNLACSYILHAARNGTNLDGPAGWTVIGYEKPKFGCN